MVLTLTFGEAFWVKTGVGSLSFEHWVIYAAKHQNPRPTTRKNVEILHSDLVQRWPFELQTAKSYFENPSHPNPAKVQAIESLSGATISPAHKRKLLSLLLETFVPRSDAQPDSQSNEKKRKKVGELLTLMEGISDHLRGSASTEREGSGSSRKKPKIDLDANIRPDIVVHSPVRTPPRILPSSPTPSCATRNTLLLSNRHSKDDTTNRTTRILRSELVSYLISRGATTSKGDPISATTNDDQLFTALSKIRMLNIVNDKELPMIVKGARSTRASLAIPSDASITTPWTTDLQFITEMIKSELVIRIIRHKKPFQIDSGSEIEQELFTLLAKMATIPVPDQPRLDAFLLPLHIPDLPTEPTFSDLPTIPFPAINALTKTPLTDLLHGVERFVHAVPKLANLLPKNSRKRPSWNQILDTFYIQESNEAPGGGPLKVHEAAIQQMFQLEAGLCCGGVGEYSKVWLWTWWALEDEYKGGGNEGIGVSQCLGFLSAMAELGAACVKRNASGTRKARDGVEDTTVHEIHVLIDFFVHAYLSGGRFITFNETPSSPLLDGFDIDDVEKDDGDASREATDDRRDDRDVGSVSSRRSESAERRGRPIADDVGGRKGKGRTSGDVSSGGAPSGPAENNVASEMEIVAGSLPLDEVVKRLKKKEVLEVAVGKFTPFAHSLADLSIDPSMAFLILLAPGEDGVFCIYIHREAPMLEAVEPHLKNVTADTHHFAVAKLAPTLKINDVLDVRVPVGVDMTKAVQEAVAKADAKVVEAVK
ncbi:hypothetical protein HK097_007008 [Rhizophlyctis rosea]|uniref:Uncharacterized protein n=1 Tax=Rhizophlyctis rosea TaxID=64517 RepID=A0AAD5X1W8_9FUNG|nr:hypothetical protein HK097_007008 [Rhizophlyctis rosea]